MAFASTGRRRWLQAGVAILGVALVAPRAEADPAAVAPIQELCDALIGTMRAGPGTPFAQRFAMLAPLVDKVFDLPAILQVSVGRGWSSLPADQQATLLTAFRRYTVANYVNSFDSFSGQHFDVQP